jgi:hypothetical protein
LNGRGLATSAVGQGTETAFGELGLHRLEAATLVDNIASQRVLETASSGPASLVAVSGSPASGAITYSFSERPIHPRELR